MKRILTWALSTVAIVVLLFGYKTSTSGPAQATTVAAAPVDPSGTAAPTATSTTTGETFTGSVAQTRWGAVQVRITVTDGRITDVTVPRYPDGNGKDQQINSYALPILTQDTLTNQNADIDMISGATVTSDGYVESLQSALDQAGLA
ncbi:MAG: FMN-binding protein [Pseudonocardia sp.]|nr:FMN-binding protein [Pseudonocardia sp.]